LRAVTRGPLPLTAALGLLCATAGAQPAAPPMDPRDAAREVHTQNGYPDSVNVTDGAGGLQSFPRRRGGGGGGERRDLQRSGRTDLDDYESPDQRRPGVEPESSGWQLPSLGGLGGVGQLLSWGMLVVGGAILLALLGFLIYTVWPRGAKGAGDDEAEPIATGLMTEDGLPFEAGDPDALAREGRYEEAILALLVQSLRAVGWRPSIEGSLTAREVLWSIGHGDARRAPLAKVVEGAERVRFGGEPATRAIFEALRPHRDALLAADQREAA